MPKLFKKIKRIGTLPPHLISNAEEKISTKIRMLEYNKDFFEEKECGQIEECLEIQKAPAIKWINIEGTDEEVIRKAEELFGVHPLVLEDTIHTGQRPKVEDYDDYLFIVLKMVHLDVNLNDIFSEQISIILSKNFLISFQEKGGKLSGGRIEKAPDIDIFDSVRKRIRSGKGVIRQSGTDYLAYTLLDTIVDHHSIALANIGEEIDKLENSLLFQRGKNHIPHKIHFLKRKIAFFKKQVQPSIEVLNTLRNDRYILISKETEIYLRDVNDHLMKIIDTFEEFKETLHALHENYLVAAGNNLNEIIKALTIFNIIFIPLQFIAGIYGMNFEYMPELKWEHGYFVVLGVMFIIFCFMLVYFRKKKWM